ncbi:late competence development ComFB family protein [Lacrimispora sp.]|uniref:late competence development ComFB family protein n=1 Tax=Lacrimispora sp. TaxID=2719234 RepID=UPI0028AE4170|nr:late competence development ComFB family protein [Lacrimispora sp.]
MARKSSKTAHVMNLLAGDEPETSKSEAAKENQAASLNTDSSETIKELTVLAHKASIQTQEGPLAPSPISIIDMSSSAPDPVSEMIRQQLEDEEGIGEAATKDVEPDNTSELVSDNVFSDKTMTDEETVNNSITEEMIADGTMNDETFAGETLNDKTMDDETFAGETLNDKAMDDETFVGEALGDKATNDETLAEEAISKEEIIQPEVENDLNLVENLEAKNNSDDLNHSEEDFSSLESPSENKEESPVVLTATEVNVIETDFKDPKTNSAPETKTSEVKEETSSPELEKPTFKYLNVMEHVVQNKVHEYAAKLDACCCGHCIADITALTLTNLPPKYVVVEPPSASPLLNFYVNRYSQQVFVELTKACFTVKQNPHH